MTRLFKLLLPALLSLTLAACSGPCQDIDTVSETTHGTFVYTASNAPIWGSSTTRASLSEPEVSAPVASSILLNGEFGDDHGNWHTFTLTAAGVATETTTMLGEGSQLCFDENPCVPVTGSLGTSVFTTDCRDGDCALTVQGNLTAAASWSGASLSVDVALGHQDAWQTYTCSTETTGS